jgi:hypothetical protein
VLVILVERHVPRHLLRPRVDLDRAAQSAEGLEQIARDFSDGPVGSEPNPCHPPVAVLGESFVRVQVERDHERPRAVGRRQWKRLPAARAETQGGVLQLRLGRGERYGELSEDLRMRVERVARRAPRGVGKLRPLRGHGCKLPTGAVS